MDFKKIIYLSLISLSTFIKAMEDPRDQLNNNDTIDSDAMLAWQLQMEEEQSNQDESDIFKKNSKEKETEAKTEYAVDLSYPKANIAADAILEFNQLNHRAKHNQGKQQAKFIPKYQQTINEQAELALIYEQMQEQQLQEKENKYNYDWALEVGDELEDSSDFEEDLSDDEVSTNTKKAQSLSHSQKINNPKMNLTDLPAELLLMILKKTFDINADDFDWLDLVPSIRKAFNDPYINLCHIILVSKVFNDFKELLEKYVHSNIACAKEIYKHILANRFAQGYKSLNQESLNQKLKDAILNLKLNSDTEQSELIIMKLIIGSADPNLKIENTKNQGSIDILSYILKLEALKQHKFKYRNELVSLLIFYGADLKTKDYFGRTPLYYALKLGDMKLIKLLLRNGASQLALSEADQADLAELERKFSEKETANPNTPSNSDNCANFNIEAYYDVSEAQHILDSDAQKLFDAVYGDNIVALNYLLKRNINVNVKGPLNQTPLHIACIKGSNITAKTLLEYGADWNAENDNGLTPIDCAMEHGHTKLAETLRNKVLEKIDRTAALANSAPFLSNESWGNRSSRTMPSTTGQDRPNLAQALQNNQTESSNKNKPLARFDAPQKLAESIAQSSDKNIEQKVQNNNGESKLSNELHAACRGGFSAKAKSLLDSGADVNAKDKTGKTPLHFAVITNNLDMIILLRQYHADTKATDNKGLTAYDYAVKSGNQNLISALI